ncbi:MAG: putative toxin-antitoxin system toxin component, PIN family [Bacteroidaceae bacterium]|nr:putative toxin-antitoxin system toxin component, PIN family [Bacteroidaceae bacterium]
MIYAVIDTNVLVSALWTSNPDSPTLIVLEGIFRGYITPLIHGDILREYDEVLRRPKFHFPTERVDTLMTYFAEHGILMERTAFWDKMPDEDDRVFFEVSLSREDSFLVTGNLKHYPPVRRIVTPAEMAEMLGDR